MKGSLAPPPGVKSIPNHWAIAKLKHIAAVRASNVDKKAEEGEELVRLCNYVDVYYNDRITEDIDFMKATASPKEIRRFRLRKGDVLVTKDSESWNDIAVPAFVCQDFDDVLCGYHLAQIRPDLGRIDGRFLFYCFAAKAFNRQLQVSANGVTRFGLPVGELSSAVFPVPPIDEQRAIVAFLEVRIAAIDVLVTRKKRLIEAAESKREAAIAKLVTKGLVSGPFDDSGIPWIGDVASHWEVVRTRFVARLESGHTPSRQHPEYWVPEECTIPWFTLGDVWQLRGDRNVYIGDTAEKVSPRGLANSSARLLPSGTVLLSRTASVGFSGIMREPMATSQDFVNWVCGPRIRPEYLLYVFRAMRSEFRRLTMGSTHQTIYMPDVRNFRTPLPPLEEQDAIVDAVRRESSRYHGLVENLSKQIDRLREYRQTLISAAVTGQLNVGAHEMEVVVR